MTLRHLKIFISVVDSGSMVSASKALYISQPTVSQAIGELEEYYGVKLFDRLSRRLYITEAGKKLLGYARHITSLYGEMEQAMKNPDKSGILKIGASVTIGTSLLPELVNKFLESYPLIQIKAIVKNTQDIENLISKNELDFAVVEGVVHTREIVSVPFMDDELVLVCGRKHSLYGKKNIDAALLVNHDFIVREAGSGTRELFESIMAANNLQWNLAWDCSSSEGLKSAALSGIGIAAISEKLVGKEVEAGELSIINVKDFDLRRKFSIVYHKNKYLTESMKAFFALCYEK